MEINQVTYTSKILTDLCSKRQKIKIKNTFAKVFYSFSSKNVLTEHTKVCLSISGPQSVRLDKGTIEFENFFK